MVSDQSAQSTRCYGLTLVERMMTIARFMALGGSSVDESLVGSIRESLVFMLCRCFGGCAYPGLLFII
ncbi:MAG: hypothetical protein KME27_27230 [Lyngbya sp. HA4199-MV5]|nr:hypothetical protein [Lyngbya sp. HA4199-MV5]